MLFIWTAWQTSAFASCSYDVRLARIPAQFQALESESEMDMKRFALVSRGYTDREADSLIFGLKKDLCIKKFLRHASSKVFHDFALAHDLRLPNEKVLLLSLLRFPTLIRLLNAPSKVLNEIELVQIAKVFARSSIEVSYRMAGQLKAQGSSDPTVVLEIGPEDVIFRQVSERIGQDLQPTTIHILKALHFQENEDRTFLWSLLKYHEEHVPYFADSKNTP
jgi:hypothetical protein